MICRKVVTVAASFFVLSLGVGCSMHSEPGATDSRESNSGAIAASPDAIAINPVKFEQKKPERWVLPNGLVVHFIYDAEVPKIRGTMMIPGGSLFDPADETGVFQILGEQIREGSIKGMSPQELDKTLDDMAAGVESSYGVETGSLSFGCLAEDFDKVFSLFGRVVREPAFDESRLNLMKKLAIEKISRRKDDPETMSGVTFAQLVYGADSPYGRIATKESIARINRARMQDLYKRWVRPNGSHLIVVGAIDKEKLAKAIEERFGNWPAAKDTLPEVPTVDTTVRRGVYVVEREFDQASVSIGHLGPPRIPEDIYEMSIYNRVFGTGGFGSMLFNEIRTKLGLAYDVGGGLAPGVGLGTFQVGMGTRATEVDKAILRVVELIEQTRAELPDDQRFSEAKSSVERSFIFRFASALEVANRAATLELFNYPKDYDATYLANVASVTKERVRAVGSKWVKPQDLVIVIVGKVSADKIKEQLKPLGLPVYRVKFGDAPVVEGEV